MPTDTPTPDGLSLGENPLTFSVQVNQTLTVPAPGLLGNVNNPSGCERTIDLGLLLPAHGELTQFGDDGSFTYVPDDGFEGEDSFSYVVSCALPAVQGVDPGASVEGEVLIQVGGGTATTTATTAPTATQEVTDLPDTGARPSGTNTGLLGAILVAAALAGIGFLVRRKPAEKKH